PEAETPPASAFELAEAIKTRPDFRDGCGEAERLFGRALSQAELEKLYYIYAVQGLGGAVLVLLLNDCVEEYRRRHGESKTPSVTYIAHIAAEWANEGIATLEQAEEYIRSRNERRKSTYRAARAMGITGRSLSKTEEKYISAWLGLGFGPDEIEKAYDITALRTGKMSWKYMDSIIQSWHRKGLMTVEQIEKGDRRQDKAKPVMGEHERAAVERLLKD
ncbi:MAG: DnaD domain protein, partial [Oscillospiraceae bacterium]